eukprot:CAMPEP_0196819178 /NCGR_PEP_ID=MMETSP1362-20130617/69357_1 /TAXON_ID=163516 /ORGANISM="Leptocylindrus danicus, Strain CCMP1856" /LENGTH=160 /DNA_ID=CAMNT_0042197563 /DNA_START=15 /DNA_END=497 /DNA_ORIENTATION=+
MLRLASRPPITTIRTAAQRLTATNVRNKSSKSIESTAKSKSNADDGFFGTQIHHHANTVLALIFPIMLVGSDPDTSFGQGLGVITSAYISVHSYIGLNYVITDYVPKVSKKMVGPSRAVSLAISALTFAGLSKAALYSQGGLPGVVKGLWNGKTAEEKKE